MKNRECRGARQWNEDVQLGWERGCYSTAIFTIRVISVSRCTTKGENGESLLLEKIFPLVRGIGHWRRVHGSPCSWNVEKGIRLQLQQCQTSECCGRVMLWIQDRVLFLFEITDEKKWLTGMKIMEWRMFANGL